ncbi:metallophosphoesterase [Gemmatimonadota bacterium]
MPNRFRSQVFATLGMLLLPMVGAKAQTEELQITHGPYLQQVTDSSAMVVWLTNVEATSWVEYGTGSNLRSFPTYGSVAETARNSRHGLVDAYTTLHRILITDLEPGHEYRYRIFSKLVQGFRPYEVTYGGTIASEVYQFNTLDSDKESFSFTMLSDIHGDTTRLDSMLGQVFWDEVDMMFYNGDVIDYYEDESQIVDGFLDVSVDHFASEIPLILIRGNHETRGRYARRWIEHFPTVSGRFYYSFDHGPVHFLVLDSGEDKEDAHPVYWGLADFDRYRAEQAEWLLGEVNSEAFTNAEFRVVLFHIPTFGARDAHGTLHVREMWNDILNDANVDLVLNGHTHRFLHREPTEGENRYPMVVSGTNTLTRVDVSSDSLSITVTSTEGDVVESFSIAGRGR